VVTYNVCSSEASNKLGGNRLHVVEQVDALVLVLDVRVLEIFFEGQRGHAHVGVEASHLDLSRHLCVVTEGHLALHGDAASGRAGGINEGHAVLVHHGAGTGKHAHNLKLGCFLVTEVPGKRSLETLAEGDAGGENKAIVGAAHGDHLDGGAEAHELWGLAVGLAASFGEHGLHLFGVGGQVAIVRLHDLLELFGFLFGGEAVGGGRLLGDGVEGGNQEETGESFILQIEH
jgi:hypothetical protein